MESGFLDDMGSFRIEHGEKNRLNYFPLAAENGVMASITPELKGDLKRDKTVLCCRRPVKRICVPAWRGEIFGADLKTANCGRQQE